ncbi:MAG TPA: ABC transporter permease [Nevskiaceae bacterium]
MSAPADIAARTRPATWRQRAATFFNMHPRVGFAIAVVIDLILFYVLWQVLTVTRVLPPRFFPTANAVLGRMGAVLVGSEFWITLWHTVESWGAGLIIGGVLGTLSGIVLGANDRAYRFCRVVIELMRPIPPVVILPLALLLLGVTLQIKLLLIFQGIFWIVLLQAVYGVRSVDKVMLETARVYGMSRTRQFFSIQLPGSLPFIVTGIRIAAIFSLIVSIVAELVGGAPGLGNDILRAMSAGDDRSMYSLILLTGVLGVIITAGFSMLERLILFWHPSQRKVSQ